MLGRIAALLAIGALLAIATPAVAQDRVALVIGNGKYVHAGALPNPANDARAVAAALREIGFDVASGTDLDRGAMERLIRDFLRKASGAKVALLFYAGHGMQIDGRNYLVPVDARLETATDLNFETIELDRLLDSLNDPQRATIVMLDACRDNPLARSFAGKLGAARSGAVGAGLAAYANPGTGTLIAFATAPGKVALDGQGANSPFTLGLVKHLRTPGLEVRQLLTRVRKDVADATRNQQIPWDNSSLLGDVYLASMPATRPATPPPPAPPPPAAKPASLPPANVAASRVVNFHGNGVFGVLSGSANGEWVESNSAIGSGKFYFRTVSETPDEIVMFDQSRNYYLRVGLRDRRLDLRVGAQGAWGQLYHVAGIYPTEARATRRIVFHGRGIYGVFTGDAAGRWVENNSAIGTGEFHFRTLADNAGELTMYDQSRDYYLRFDLAQRKISLRHTVNGQWVVLYDITGVFN